MGLKPVMGRAETASGEGEWWGDVRALAAGLGVDGGWESGGMTRVEAATERLEEFLTGYTDRFLVPEEWPVIVAAHGHALAGRSTELLMLDRAWGERVGIRPFAEASLRTGQRQLNRLRPIRDHRVVQRYLDAVAEGRAHGWHPLVYGVWLGVFGLPLRQGLMRYSEQVLGGFVDGLPTGPGMGERERDRVLDRVQMRLPGELGRFLPATMPVVVG
jgi:hypothetical protein